MDELADSPLTAVELWFVGRVRLDVTKDDPRWLPHLTTECSPENCWPTRECRRVVGRRARRTMWKSLRHILVFVGLGFVCMPVLFMLTPNIEESSTEATTAQAYYDVSTS